MLLGVVLAYPLFHDLRIVSVLENGVAKPAKLKLQDPLSSFLVRWILGFLCLSPLDIESDANSS